MGRGTFDWLDHFLEKNPQYHEISDRMIHDWIQKSGFQKNQWNQGPQASNDKPPFSYGPQFLNDHSIRRAIMSVAPHMPRHYLVMEVKENLISVDRSRNLKR